MEAVLPKSGHGAGFVVKEEIKRVESNADEDAAGCKEDFALKVYINIFI